MSERDGGGVPPHDERGATRLTGGEADAERVARRAPTWALALLDVLNGAGHDAYLVGGFVRDAVRGVRAHDVDIACAAPWETTKRLLVAHGYTVIETGVRHGTISVLTGEAGEHPVEITTFREDGAYSDGRHPDGVRFVSSVEDDLARRDFTINAMAWNPARGLVDPFGGRDDLARGVIRAVGDPTTRFREDGLRVLRGMRFASKLGFEVEPGTAVAIHDCADALDVVAPERKGVEFDGLVAGPHAPEVLRAYTDVVTRMLPEIAPMVGFDQNSRWHVYDVWEHCLHALELLDPSASLIVRYATLLHDIGKPETYTIDEHGHGHFYGHEQAGAITARSVFRRLRWRSIDMDHACVLIRVHDRHIEATRRGVLRTLARLGRSYIGADAIVTSMFRELLQLKRADTAAHAPSTVEARLEQLDEVERVFEQVLAERDVFLVRDLAVTGRDVMACGVPRGPEVGAILRDLLGCVVDGTLPNDREALLAATRARVSSAGSSAPAAS